MDYLQIVIPAAFALVITIIGTPLFIPVLKKIKARQSIREEGPQSHLTKSGTPTMGGIVIIAAVAAACLLTKGLSTDMIIILTAFYCSAS